jgi:hypothetical protein
MDHRNMSFCLLFFQLQLYVQGKFDSMHQELLANTKDAISMRGVYSRGSLIHSCEFS